MQIAPNEEFDAVATAFNASLRNLKTLVSRIEANPTEAGLRELEGSLDRTTPVSAAETCLSASFRWMYQLKAESFTSYAYKLDVPGVLLLAGPEIVMRVLQIQNKIRLWFENGHYRAEFTGLASRVASQAVCRSVLPVPGRESARKDTSSGGRSTTATSRRPTPATGGRPTATTSGRSANAASGRAAASGGRSESGRPERRGGRSEGGGSDRSRRRSRSRGGKKTHAPAPEPVSASGRAVMSERDRAHTLALLDKVAAATSPIAVTVPANVGGPYLDALTGRTPKLPPAATEALAKLEQLRTAAHNARVDTPAVEAPTAVVEAPAADEPTVSDESPAEAVELPIAVVETSAAAVTPSRERFVVNKEPETLSFSSDISWADM